MSSLCIQQASAGSLGRSLLFPASPAQASVADRRGAVAAEPMGSLQPVRVGSGLLAAITLDGIPENLALGVALISGNVMQVAALAGSILLSNLPEAAGGAKEMRRNGASNKKVLMLWIGAAILLSLAAILGKVLLKNVDDAIISAINCFAAGAVIASLATEVFPTAFKRSNHWAGISTTVGLILALALNQLGG